MKPPTDVPASVLFRKLQESPAPNEVVDFPRKGADGLPIGKCRIFALGMEDHYEARFEGREWVIDKLKKRGENAPLLDEHLLKEMVGDAVARQLLMRAVRDEKSIPNPQTGEDWYPFVFTDIEALDRTLRAPELETLFRAYELTQHKYGPFSGNILNEDELNGWVKRLVEGAENFPTMRCDWLQLADLNSSLAHRVFTLSAVLEFLFSSLPPTLASSLDGLGIGIGLFGSPPVRCLLPGVDLPPQQGESAQPQSKDRSSDDGDLEPMGADRPVTTERAMQLAKDLSDLDVPEV